MLAHLNAIHAALSDLTQDSNGLTAQQLTFIQHMQRIADQLAHMVAPMPTDDAALWQLIPILGDAFSQPQTALYGYAKMLLEAPQLFGATAGQLSDGQCEALNQIYTHGIKLAQKTQALCDEAHQQRQQNRHQPAHDFDLSAFIAAQMPVYGYWVRDKAITLQSDLSPHLPPIHAQSYHVHEIVRHIVTTLADELVEYGVIRLYTMLATPEAGVVLGIFCTGTQLTPDELDILFKRQGRNLYRRQIAKQGAQLMILREAGIGAHIRLHFQTTLT